VSHQWQSLYQRAESDSESDLSQLHRRIMDAESAMFERSIELNNGQGQGDEAQREREAIREAASELLRIKTEKLKWPTF
jgi:hypothetical protein